MTLNPTITTPAKQMKPTTFYLILITGLLLSACTLPAMAERTKLKRNVAFIVRKPDRVKNIAARFHVMPKTLTMLNSPLRKKQMVYAGKKLIIPVYLKKKTGPAKESSDFNIADYEWNTDSLDATIREDFVCMAEIEADTMRRIAIDRESRMMDRKIAILSYRMDSIEQVESGNSTNLSKREIRQLKIARANRTGDFAIGTEVDSLRQQRIRLSDEKTKIDMRVEDYENLVDNASYMAAHPYSEDNRTIMLREWGDDPDKVPALSGTRKK